jgi:hypothetical protein
MQISLQTVAVKWRSNNLQPDSNLIETSCQAFLACVLPSASYIEMEMNLGGFSFGMYAATSNSKIYHLTEPPGERTLCGVKFMPIIMEQPRAAGLSLLRTKPDGYSLCQHCNRVRSQESSI